YSRPFPSAPVRWQSRWQFPVDGLISESRIRVSAEGYLHLSRPTCAPQATACRQKKGRAGRRRRGNVRLDRFRLAQSVRRVRTARVSDDQVESRQDERGRASRAWAIRKRKMADNFSSSWFVRMDVSSPSIR